MSDEISNARNPFRTNTIITVIAVTFMCCLVLVPTVKSILETQISARYLLSAFDSLEKGDLDASQKSLERAVAWSNEVSPDDLLMFRLSRWILEGKAEQAIAIVQQRKGLDRFQLAYIAYELFFAIGDFTHSLVCAKILVDSPQLSTVEKLNLTAYSRALANVELPQALKDIEVAVKVDNSPGVVDTQAWIQHELGQNEDALNLMNVAIERAAKQVKAKESKETATTSVDKGETLAANKPGRSETSQDSTDDFKLKESIELLKSYAKDNVNPLKTLAVMHFHRAKILESLDQDASADWKWLDDHGFKNRSVLY